MYVNIKEDDIWEGGRCPSKSDRVVTVKALKEKEKGIMSMSPKQVDINKPMPKVKFRVSEFSSPPPGIPSKEELRRGPS